MPRASRTPSQRCPSIATCGAAASVSPTAPTETAITTACRAARPVGYTSLPLLVVESSVPLPHRASTRPRREIFRIGHRCADRLLLLADTSHVPCKFFRQGACQAGNACPFSHDLGTASENICKYFAKVSSFFHGAVGCGSAALVALDTYCVNQKDDEIKEGKKRRKMVSSFARKYPQLIGHHTTVVPEFFFLFIFKASPLLCCGMTKTQFLSRLAG